MIRIDPATGAAAPGNALGGAPDANARRIVGYGLRNPFRFAFRPNSRELWIADVGSNTADEVDRIDDPTAPAHDFGWPCYEGFGPEPAFEPVGLELCTALYAQPDAVTQPYATFPVVTSDSTCDGRPTLSGVAFEESAPAGLFPAPYTGALFLADYTRSCVFVLPRGADGLPDPALVTLFASGLASPVDLTFGPDGALYYVDYDGGTVRRIAPTAPPAGLDYPSRATYATGAHAHGLALADLDADGKADLAVANAGASSVSVLLGHGDGTFGAAVSFAVGSEPKSVAAGDLNGDGHVDLVTANQGSNTVSILLGDGNGTFAAAVAVPACEHPHEVAVGQFDGDPAPDLAVACWGGSVVGVLLGKGDGTFAPELLVPAGDAPHSIVARDLDGDGIQDLAVADHGSNAVTVLLANGDGTFAAADYAVGDGPHSIRAGDLDGNGAPDLVVANDASDSVSVLLGAGDGTFPSVAARRSCPVPPGWAGSSSPARAHGAAPGR